MIPLHRMAELGGGRRGGITIGDIHVGGGGDLATMAQAAADAVFSRIMSSGAAKGAIARSQRGRL